MRLSLRLPLASRIAVPAIAAVLAEVIDGAMLNPLKP